MYLPLWPGFNSWGPAWWRSISRDFSLTDHTLPTRLQPAWQKMAQSPLNGTTQPVEIEEEGWSPTKTDNGWGENRYNYMTSYLFSALLVISLSLQACRLSPSYEGGHSSVVRMRQVFSTRVRPSQAPAPASANLNSRLKVLNHSTTAHCIVCAAWDLHCTLIILWCYYSHLWVYSRQRTDL